MRKKPDITFRSQMWNGRNQNADNKDINIDWNRKARAQLKTGEVTTKKLEDRTGASSAATPVTLREVANNSSRIEI